MTTENTSDNPQYNPTTDDILAISESAAYSLANHLKAAAKLAAGIKTPIQTPNKLTEAERWAMTVIYEYHCARRATGTKTNQEETHRVAKSVFLDEQRLCRMVESEAAHAH